MLTQLTNLAENHPVSSARAPSSLKDPAMGVTITKKPVGDTASNKLAAETGAKEGRTGTPTSAKGKPFNQPSFSNFLYIPETTGLLKLMQRGGVHIQSDSRERTVLFPSASRAQHRATGTQDMGSAWDRRGTAVTHHIMELFVSPPTSRVIPGTESGCV